MGVICGGRIADNYGVTTHTPNRRGRRVDPATAATAATPITPATADTAVSATADTAAPDATMPTVTATPDATPDTAPVDAGMVAFASATMYAAGLMADAMADANVARIDAATAAPAPVALVPYVATPANAYAANVLRQLLADPANVVIDPDALALAIAGIERTAAPVATAATAAPSTHGNRGRVVHQTADQRAAVIAAGLPGRQIYNARAFGPFIVGASNASGGAVVRDTRMPGHNNNVGDPVCDVYLTSTVSDALRWVHATHPDATAANATADALARINARRVAR